MLITCAAPGSGLVSPVAWLVVKYAGGVPVRGIPDPVPVVVRGDVVVAGTVAGELHRMTVDVRTG
ncbi:hypothetical protein [Microbacterium gorillae]|uniref:hypothetical protein n=1 Tax=Microbacterium gorillae TaxID=1231063 RepID=UPI003D9984F4